MLGLLPLLPAYGRDYSSASALIADFVAGKDFRSASGTYVGREELLGILGAGARIQARYARGARVCSFVLGKEPKPRAPRAASMEDLRAKCARAEGALARATARAEKLAESDATDSQVLAALRELRSKRAALARALADLDEARESTSEGPGAEAAR